MLKALSPTYALDFLTGHFSVAFFSLAAVVLAITGAEALYADMGHFGRAPITVAWLILVLPACILSYLGQGAYLLENPGIEVSGLFFLLVPDWAQLPMVFLATAATVIASQAVITGAFSVAHQAVQLGYLPRLRIAYTSEHTAGAFRPERHCANPMLVPENPGKPSCEAEGVGFEPTRPLARPNGFQGRRIQPLCHPSGRG